MKPHGSSDDEIGMTAENERDGEAPARDDPERPEADAASGGANGAGPDAREGTVDAADDGEAPDGDAFASDDEEGAAGSLEARLAAAEAQAAAHWDRLVRLQAELENQRKRAQREVASARKYGLEDFVRDLLPVKDSLELGIRAAAGEEADIASLREGSELTLKMLAQVLEKHAVVEIDPEGEKFDPDFHQAMSAQPVEGVAPNTVTAVMQKGYLLNDRLIRPALVMVSK